MHRVRLGLYDKLVDAPVRRRCGYWYSRTELLRVEGERVRREVQQREPSGLQRPPCRLRLIDATHSFAEWRATGYLIGGQHKYEFEHAVHGKTMRLTEVICLQNCHRLNCCCIDLQHNCKVNSCISSI